MTPTPAPVDPAVAALLFEASLDCVKVLDPSGQLVSMNRNGERLLELDFNAVCGVDWDALWPPEAQSRVRKAIEGARAGQADRFTAFCPTATGTPKWWDVSVSPVFDPEGNVISILSVSRDTTDLHMAQRQHEEAADRLRFVMDSAGIGDWEFDIASGRARTSPQHDRCFGLETPTDGWTSAEFFEHIHPDDHAHIEAAVERTLQDGSDFRYEARVIWPDGSIHWIEVTGRLHQAPNDGACKLMGTVREITHRKAVEVGLQEASAEATRLAVQSQLERQRVDALLQAAPVGIAYADASGSLQVVNAANHEIWGDNPFSENVDEYVEWKGWWADGSERHGHRIEPHEWGLARALRGEDVAGDLIEIEPFDAPGIRRNLLLQAAPTRDARGEVSGAVVVQMDVTEQVRAQAKLRESEARFRTITDAMPQMVWSTRPDGYHDYYNQQWYEYTGVPPGSTDGEAWNGMFHPDDQDRAWEIWRHSLATGETYEVEYRLRHHSGEYRWVLGRALPVLDERGRIVRWMGTCTDIHEHRLMLETLTDRDVALRLADRRKDEFLAMLAHELRNPLAPISTAAQLLTVPGIQPGQVAQSSAIIARQVRHMTNLVDDLLDVSRVTCGQVSLEVETFDLRDAVRGAIEQARPLVEGRQHALRTRLPAEPVWVEGDQTRLTQVVANLLNNAAKYTPQRGEIGVDLKLEGADANVRVCDDGVGIDATLLPHVFELFTQGERTPDRSQGGLGIGLALVKSLIELQGGVVRVQSDGAGAGSTFTVTLPTAAAPDPTAASDIAPATPRRTLDIVVVDDNVDAARTLATLLEIMGHRTRVFETGREALASIASGAADAYILDIGLPGMSGHELAQHLRTNTATRDALLIALSGYGGSQARSLSLKAGFDDHLVKPVDPSLLMSHLSRR